jgi:hypothetical protein
MVSHRRPANHRKGVGFALLLAIALTIFLTTALGKGRPPAEGSSHSAAATLARGAAIASTRAAPTTRPVVAKQPRRHVILVVGDSLVAQAASQLRGMSTAAVTVQVAAELGSAPCDWTTGSFDAALQQFHPDVVVLAFVGNDGLTSGCVSEKQAFPLTELLGNYRVNLTALADRATAAGATVIIATAPARNPAAPPPPSTPTAGELAAPDQFYGFQGVPELRALYAQIAASNTRWHLSNAAALAISPDFIYKQVLRCSPGDGSCPDGFVAVRKGLDDAIHLDPTGNGAKRYAKALVASAVTIADHSRGA